MCLCSLLPHTSPLPDALSLFLGEYLTQPKETHICQCRHMEPGWSVVVFSKCFYWFNAKSASAYFLDIVQQTPKGSPPHPHVLGQGHLCACGFPSSQALPPFTLYLWTWQTALATVLNILHINTNWFPSAPVGRGERVPLLWPMKRLGPF